MAENKIPLRDEIPDQHKWDLTPLYHNQEQWQQAYDKLSSEIDKYSNYQGKLADSIEIFKEAIDFDLYVERELDKLYTFAHLKNDEDKTNNTYQEIYQKAINLYTRISELASFFTPEIQNLPTEIIQKYIEAPELKLYLFYLEKILRHKAHTLSPEIEKILAMGGDVTRASAEIFSQLDNADMTFGTLKNSKGETHELSHGNFNSFLCDADRNVREKAFNQYYTSYDNHKQTIATTLAYSNKKDAYYSKIRNFQSCRQSALFSDNVNEKVYDNLLYTVKANMEPLTKYLDFRKKTLKVDQLHIYDTYVPLVKEVDFHMPYEEAVEVCVKSLSALGEDYTKKLREGLLGGWVDRFENKGKRSGAYSSGCYDSPPYILLNYDENNINSLYTLIHEAGHSMHTYFSSKKQPFIYHNYTIFVAEVASTFNETLLSAYLLEYYKDDNKMKAYILNREIDNIRGTLYRQSMFAEFEKITHDIVEKNQPLTLETMRKEYRKLLETYFNNTLEIDDLLELECLRIPHFYSAFYVYKYATGISAAIALADKVLNNEKNACENYRQFLTLGGSKFPIDELQIAGVDMNTKEPVQNALTYFDKIVNEFIEVYEKI